VRTRDGKPVRWGFLSTARINDKVLRGARDLDDVQVVAVASRSRARAERYARSKNIDRAYGGYEQLLADPDVDAVYISLPNHLHVEWSILALEAGKHVLCEKPLSRRAAAAEQAFDVADRNGLVLSEAFMWRHNPQTRELERLVAEGAIGKVRRITAVFGFDLGGGPRPGGLRRVARRLINAVRRPQRDVRLAPDYDGGALMDVGCYCVNAIRLLGGEPRRVEAEQVLGPTGVDLQFTGRLELGEGIESSFECGLAMPARDELEVTGTEGSLYLDDPFLCVNPEIELHRHGEPLERIAFDRVDSYRLELENVADAIRDRSPLLLGRVDALGQARALEALQREALRV
jgi:xylose dehydrogenase (NAD/NADP)